MEKKRETENICIRNQTIYFNNNNQWSKWRDKSLTLHLRKKFLKKKNKKEPVEKDIKFSELTYLDFLKYMGELTYKIYSDKGTLIFTLPSAVAFIHKKIGETKKSRYSDKKIIEQKELITYGSVKFNIDRLNGKLDEICPGHRFFKKVDNGYVLCIYAINAPIVKDGIGGRISLVPHENILEQHIGTIIQLDKKLKKYLIRIRFIYNHLNNFLIKMLLPNQSFLEK